ncbi:MAG: BlaI/MecI/CopY family transcriptional regulator [Clostridiales bacterium]|jgi:predicted transcriptional regulator|nr:BlaI/MecI/CopY family transcriptional regulator [Clostridiales bacterium]
MTAKKLTPKQLDVMQILWDSDKPLVASDIVKMNDDFNANTVQSVIRTLLGKKYIEVAEIVYSGTVLSRSYTAIVSKDEYIKSTFFSNNSVPSLVFNLIESESDLSVLDEMQKLIEERKNELSEEK